MLYLIVALEPARVQSVMRALDTPLRELQEHGDLWSWYYQVTD